MTNETEYPRGYKRLLDDIWAERHQTKFGQIYLWQMCARNSFWVTFLGVLALFFSSATIVTAFAPIPLVGDYLPGIFAAIAGLSSILSVVGPWGKRLMSFRLAHTFAGTLDIECDRLWRDARAYRFDKVEDLETQFDDLRQRWTMLVSNQIDPHKWDEKLIGRAQDMADVQVWHEYTNLEEAA